jgi:CheY-like chemotaxis protein
MLRRRGIGSPREQRLIDGAFASAERAKTLVHRLLAFARRQPLQSVAVDIGALIRDVADLVAGTTGPQVNVALDIADDLPSAKADPHQLEMAILNLSVNARDAMDGIGTIRIAAALATVAAGEIAQLKPGSYVRLSVADTGIGMDEATLARAVEPFFSTKGIGKGTGLGLSMAHGLTSQLGGTLTIASVPGRGTEVSMWLPVASHPAPAPAEARCGQAAMLHPGLALLVDDEEHIRLSTADMLAELGFSVHEAASGEAALRAIDDGLQPDILITDHLMPGMTGVELAHAIRLRRPATTILIVSGFAEREGIDPSLPRLTKPFVRSELVTALAGLHPE